MPSPTLGRSQQLRVDVDVEVARFTWAEIILNWYTLHSPLTKEKAFRPVWAENAQNAREMHTVQENTLCIKSHKNVLGNISRVFFHRSLHS